jgi:hypothetical protein
MPGLDDNSLVKFAPCFFYFPVVNYKNLNFFTVLTFTFTIMQDFDFPRLVEHFIPNGDSPCQMTPKVLGVEGAPLVDNLWVPYVGDL